MNEFDPVEEWLGTCSSKRYVVYKVYFQEFEKFMKNSGERILKEAHEFAKDPERRDYYSEKVYEFSKRLPVRRVGTLRGKPVSQITSKSAVAAVQSFFRYHSIRINLGKFRNRDARLQRPRGEERMQRLVSEETQALIRIAGARDKAMLALGLMGQDQSVVSSLRIEWFEGKLSRQRLEFVTLLRPKKKIPIKLLLTSEVQRILADYIRALGKNRGWLFEGRKGRNISPSRHNSTFRRLCKQAGIVDNGRRLNYQCLRAWFSNQLRNRLDPRIIGFMMGQETGYGSDCLAWSRNEEEFRESLARVDVEELLRLQEIPSSSLVKELEEQKQIIAQQAEKIENLRKVLFDVIAKLRKLESESSPRGSIGAAERKSETEMLKEEIMKLKQELQEIEQSIDVKR